MKHHTAFTGLAGEHRDIQIRLKQLLQMTQEEETIVSGVKSFLAGPACVIAQHLRSEDETLLPMYVHIVGSTHAHVSRAISEHMLIRERLLTLERALVSGEELGEIVETLANAISTHIRFEERSLYPAIEKALPSDQLGLMGVRLAAMLRA